MPPYVGHLLLKLLFGSVVLALIWGKVSPSLCAWAHLEWLPPCDDASGLFNVAAHAGATFSALLLIFQTWIWRTWLGRKVFGWPVPDLNGTWRGTLTPGAAPPGMALTPPRTVYLVVHQTAFGFRAVFHTPDSHSPTVAAEFTQLQDDVELVYSYHNTPRQNLQSRSPVHYGTTILRMASESPDCLNGFYFTQRLTRGEVSFDGKAPQKAHDFAEAEALTYVARALPCAAN